MPNAQVLSEKQAVVDTLTAKLGSAAGVLVDYSGITVAEDTEMRAKMRGVEVDYTVVKNTLLRFAAKNRGLDALDPILNGTTSLAVHPTDVVAPAKIVKEFAQKLGDRFTIKGGFYDGRVISVAEVEALASIPPIKTLQAQLLGTLLAPITQLAVVVKLIAEKQGGGSIDNQDTAEVVAEAAPAEETAAAEAVEAPAEEAAPEVAAETPAEEAPAAE
ncbi:MAG: 50S ribosomal protein L10 [Oscillospiraceae bacterium]|jgi:large subunit ribosomal protein L10|nr:50S ribosomal protein L10 [Oscillospiraceae bacterium]